MHMAHRNFGMGWMDICFRPDLLLSIWTQKPPCKYSLYFFSC